MDSPAFGNAKTAEPERPPAASASGFFPDFATVRTALEAGRIGIWSWDLATDALTWSSNVETIHGLPPGALSLIHI